KQANPDPTISSRYDLVCEETAGKVATPVIIHEIKAASGSTCRQRPRGKRIKIARQQRQTALARSGFHPRRNAFVQDCECWLNRERYGGLATRMASEVAIGQDRQERSRRKQRSADGQEEDNTHH